MPHERKKGSERDVRSAVDYRLSPRADSAREREAHAALGSAEPAPRRCLREGKTCDRIEEP